ncbi:hypothetical protein EVG20_g3960 [Dentipellis fragilis]|uniref:Uncharacterized protein n=1 Tax=Dentipellis fragilis TaxID=205917 RepID=A0A4Y9YYF1_9AGAM|nr:hypothetical protein EVG20_g3960 [Dentipellis fragilis]
MKRPTPSQDIRILICLVAIKFKPPGQSIPSYIDDLRSSFASSTPEASRESNTWRKRTLELETTLREVQGISDAERLDTTAELLALRAAANGESQQPPPVEPPTKKKKTKKGPVAVAPPARTTEKTYLSQILTHAASLLSTHKSLFPALQALNALSSAIERNAETIVPPAITTATATRCIESLGCLLESAVSSSAKAPADALDLLITVIPEVLSTLLPPLLRAYTSSGKKLRTQDPQSSSCWMTSSSSGLSNLIKNTDGDIYTALDAILEPLTSRILLPTIRSFLLLIEASTKTLLDRTPLPSIKRSQPSSRRLIPPHSDYPCQPKGLLFLLSATFNALDRVSTTMPENGKRDALLQCVSFMRKRVALDVISELHRLFSTRGTDRQTTRVSSSMDSPSSATSTPSTPSSPKLSRDRRLRRLARKDALYYLCSTFSLCLSRAPLAASASVTGTTLDEILGERLADFLKSKVGKGCRGEQRHEKLDEVEEGMLLAVLEKAWGAGFDVDVGTK